MPKARLNTESREQPHGGTLRFFTVGLVVCMLTLTIPSACTLSISALRGFTCLATELDGPKLERKTAGNSSFKLEARKIKHLGISSIRNVKNLLKKT